MFILRGELPLTRVPQHHTRSKEICMTGTHSRRGGWLVLVVCFLLLAAFVGLLLYQHYSQRPWHKGNESLAEELASAELIDDPLPPERDWPQWRGLHRDGVAHQPGLLTQWPKDGPPRLWKAPGGGGYSSFAVADGRVYTQLSQEKQDVVICLNVTYGKELWRHASEAKHLHQYPGPRSTPTVDAGRVYTVGAGGELVCLDGVNGSPQWQHDLATELGARGGQWGQSFSPLIVGNLLITSPGGPGACLAAFDKISGDLVWKAHDDLPGYSSPVMFTAAGVPQVVAFTGNSVIGVLPETGRLLWRYPWETSFNVNVATPLTIHARRRSKAIAEESTLDYVLISSGYGKGCALLKIDRGRDGEFTAEPVYENNYLCSHFGSPVRYGDSIFGFNESQLTCIDVRTGEVRWHKGGFNKGTLVRVDGKLIILGENGQLAVLDATATEPAPLASAKIFRGPCWTMPVLAGGRLFLRDENEIICLDLVHKK
jgi:outer membrane protein assembly factor BamB